MLLPFICAFAGYMIYYDRDVFYSLFSAVRVYVASFDMSYASLQDWAAAPGHTPQMLIAMRILLECGRWLGLGVTATFLTNLLKNAWKRETVLRDAHRRDAVALHGSAKYRRLLAASIRERTIVDDLPEKFCARRHVLAFESDRELFAYLTAHFDQLAPATGAAVAARHRSVYLCLTSPLQTHYDDRGFIISNMSEICARIYWQRLYVRRFNDHPERRIALVGFGKYGQALLKQALLTNLFVEPAEMEYHVFGDSAEFQRQHPGLSGLASIGATQPDRDAIFYHTEAWSENLPLLLSADRIILADDLEENNLLALSSLKENNAAVRVHLRVSDARLAQAFWPGRAVAEYDPAAELCVFGTDRSLYTRRIVMDESLILAAKCISAQYMRRTGKGDCSSCRHPETLADCARSCKALNEDWQALGHFLQEANMLQADHIAVKLRQMLKQDCELSANALESYAQRYAQTVREGGMTPFFAMEHERWMRHHYYYNWEYAEKRDDANRKHPLMVPYDQLPELQKPKDADPYAVIPEIGRVVMQAFGDPATTRAEQRPTPPCETSVPRA